MNRPEPQGSHPGEMQSFARVLRRRKWSVIGLTAIVVVSATAFTALQTPRYSANSRVLVKPLNSDQALAGFNYAFLVSMQTEQALAESPAVARGAADLMTEWSGQAPLGGSLEVAVPPETTFLDFTYTDEDPDVAASWAEAYARAYAADREARAATAYASAAQGYQTSIDQVNANLQAQLAALEVAAPEDAPAIQDEIDALRSQINVLRVQLAQLPVPAADTAQTIAHAQAPTSPSSPDPVRNLALAVLVGLSLGVCLALVRERFDERVVGRQDLDELIGAPTLAIVPKASGWRGRGKPKLYALERPSSAPAEATRTIRANLEYRARADGLRTIMVTSGARGEGKTTTAANLAVSLAQTGKRVIVLSCDLRKPRLHRFFGLPNDHGVTTLLNGESSLTGTAMRCGVPSLLVLASGPVPDNPAELLGSEQMDGLLTDLRRLADYVVIDSPPVLAVADAVVLAPLVDGIIVVVNAESTTRDSVTAVREQLEQVGATIVGGVYNNLDPRRARYYPAHYHHYYTYREDRKASRSEAPGPSLETVSPDTLWREVASPPPGPVLGEQPHGANGEVPEVQRSRQD